MNIKKAKKVLVHDYCGHLSPVQLSRELAKRNYNVLHLYFSDFQGPNGAIEKTEKDSKNYNSKGIKLDKPFHKYSFIKRRHQEIQYGKAIVKEIDRFKPDIFISSSTPLDAQKIIQKKCIQDNISFIFWLQDIIGIAIYSILSKKLKLIGKIIGKYYQRMEQYLLNRSDAIINITDDFLPILQEWDIDTSSAYVIPNWAPIEEIPVCNKNNDWAIENKLQDKFVFLYSGTMGLKHNPKLLLKLSEKYKGNDSVMIVVISEGLGADYLVKKKTELNLGNLLILSFQAFEVFPEVLGSANILLGILDKEAGKFSVPSKVLSYLCAQKPLLLAMPQDNLAAKIVIKSDGGFVVDTDDTDGFINASEKLFNNDELRDRFGSNARKYAEKIFSIRSVANQFEEIFRKFGLMEKSG